MTRLNFYSSQHAADGPFRNYLHFCGLGEKYLSFITKCKLAVLLIFSVSLNTIYAEVKIGKFGAIALGLDASLYNTNNITMDASPREDFVTSILPTINFRNSGGSLSIEAFFGQEVISYSKNSNYDSEDFKSKWSLKYPENSSGEIVSLLLEGGVNQYNLPISSISGVGNMVSTQETDLAFGGEYYMNQRITFLGSVSYLDFDSNTLTYSDLNSLTVPLSVNYDYDESISVGLGFRHRSTRMGGQIVSAKAESDDQAFYCIFENNRSAVWDYKLEAGIQRRDFKEDEIFTDINGLFASATTTWQATERSRFKGELSNEFGTTLANQSTEVSKLSLKWDHIISEHLQIFSGIGYEEISYDQTLGTREDERTTSILGLEYTMLGGNWILRGSIEHTENKSSLTRANYDATYSSIRSIIVF